MPHREKIANHRYDDELRRKEAARPGRIILGVIFLTIAGLNISAFLLTTPQYRSIILAQILIVELWTTVAIIGTWYRKKWGRYLLAGFCALKSLVLVIIGLQTLTEGHRISLFLIISTMAHIGIFLVVAYSPPIRILTRRRY